jgi:hypothetical protein
MTLLVALLAAGLLTAPAHAVKISHFTPAELARFEEAEIGGEVAVTRPAGDGCNSCAAYYRKVSETEVTFTGWSICSLLACPVEFPMERFK